MGCNAVSWAPAVNPGSLVEVRETVIECVTLSLSLSLFREVLSQPYQLLRDWLQEVVIMSLKFGEKRETIG